MAEWWLCEVLQPRFPERMQSREIPIIIIVQVLSDLNKVSYKLKDYIFIVYLTRYNYSKIPTPPHKLQQYNTNNQN